MNRTNRHISKLTKYHKAAVEQMADEWLEQRVENLEKELRKQIDELVEQHEEKVLEAEIEREEIIEHYAPSIYYDINEN